MSTTAPNTNQYAPWNPASDEPLVCGTSVMTAMPIAAPGVHRVPREHHDPGGDRDQHLPDRERRVLGRLRHGEHQQREAGSEQRDTDDVEPRRP